MTSRSFSFSTTYLNPFHTINVSMSVFVTLNLFPLETIFYVCWNFHENNVVFGCDDFKNISPMIIIIFEFFLNRLFGRSFENLFPDQQLIDICVYNSCRIGFEMKKQWHNFKIWTNFWQLRNYLVKYMAENIYILIILFIKPFWYLLVWLKTCSWNEVWENAFVREDLKMIYFNLIQ